MFCVLRIILGMTVNSVHYFLTLCFEELFMMLFQFSDVETSKTSKTKVSHRVNIRV